jgi:outer membrane protein TolC
MELLNRKERKPGFMKEKMIFFFFHKYQMFFFRYLLILCFVFSVVSACSQESMMTEVNTSFLQKLIDTAKAQYPRMKNFDHRVTMAQDNLKKVKLTWYEIIAFSLFYSPSNATSVTNATYSGFQVGMGFNIGSLIQKPYLIKQAKEELLVAKLNLDEYNLNIEAEVKNRYYKYLQELTLLRLQTQTAIDADGLLKQLKFKFEKGEETFENYSKALIGFTEHRRNINATETDLLIAKSNLEELIGKKIEDIH